MLVNNAGVVNRARRLTGDGLEETFAVNHLAPFKLTLLLLPRLRASAPARIVNVASEAHRFWPLDLDDLQHARGYGAMRAYGRSKLANVYFTLELARRLAGSGVTVNAVHPGAVATGLGQNNDGLVVRLLAVVTRLLFRSPARGAATSLHVAAAPGLADETGGYYVDGRRRAPHPRAADRTVAARLWAASEALTGVRLG